MNIGRESRLFIFFLMVVLGLLHYHRDSLPVIHIIIIFLMVLMIISSISILFHFLGFQLLTHFPSLLLMIDTLPSHLSTSATLRLRGNEGRSVEVRGRKVQSWSWVNSFSLSLRRVSRETRDSLILYDHSFLTLLTTRRRQEAEPLRDPPGGGWAHIDDNKLLSLTPFL